MQVFHITVMSHEYHGVSNHQLLTLAVFLQHPDSKVHGANIGPIWGRQDPGGPHELCYLGKSFFRLTSKKHQRLVSLTLCEGNPPLSGLSSQTASNTENVSISRYHYKSEFGDFRNSKYVSQTKDTYRLYHCPIHFYSLRLSTNKSAFSYHWLRKVPLVIYLGTYPFTC